MSGEFESRLSSPDGVAKFRNFVKEFESELMEKKNVCSDILSTIKLKKLNVCDGRRRWAIRVLKGISAVGVDGSQIQPLREFGIPAGAVQVAAFKVEHGSGNWDVSYTSRIVRLEENVDATRYALEMDVLRRNADGRSYLFYDGSFTPTFVREMAREIRSRYEKAAMDTVKKCSETETPLFGYTDRSYSRDIAKAHGVNIYDSFILSEMDVMSYTEPFCSGEICYCYVRFSPSLPSRVEFPEWMRRKFDQFIRVLCAECMLGSTFSYPYVLERAHSYAAVSERERRLIVEAVGGISLSFKWVSKLG